MENNANTTIQPALLNIDQSCQLLNISRRTFYRLSTSGKLGVMPVKMRSKILYCRQELENWVSNGCPARREWLAIKENLMK